MLIKLHYTHVCTFYLQNNMITCGVIVDNYNLDTPTGKKINCSTLILLSAVSTATPSVMKLKLKWKVYSLVF